eukprot:6508032-Prymnesium_polylepis.1
MARRLPTGSLSAGSDESGTKLYMESCMRSPASSFRRTFVPTMRNAGNPTVSAYSTRPSWIILMRAAISRSPMGCRLSRDCTRPLTTDGRS